MRTAHCANRYHKRTRLESGLALYGQVKRDAARLKHVDRPVIDPELRDREQLLSADIGVDTADEIKQLYLEFQKAGVEFQQTLMRQPWGAKNFVVKDADGNLLAVRRPGRVTPWQDCPPERHFSKPQSAGMSPR